MTIYECHKYVATEHHKKEEIIECASALEANEICIPRGKFKLEELKVKRDCPRPSIKEPPTYLKFKSLPPSS